MLGADPDIGTSALRLWVAAGSAALLVVLFVLMSARPQSKLATVPGLPIGLVACAALLGAAMAWAFLGAAVGDRNAEHLALERRADELTARALVPGSPLSCLDALAGETVEAACEKAIFSSPASAAAATSYIAARLALLSEVVAYVGRGGAGMDDVLVPLRRSLETDRFGLVAHVLATREGCTSQNCKTLALLRDAQHVRANLSGEAFERHLDHYLTVWNQPAGAPLADGAQLPPPGIAQSNLPGPRRVSANVDFPSAASIPPISIMNPEPTGPVLPGVAAAAAANPNPLPAPPSRHSHKQTGNSSPQTSAQATLSVAPATEPIWPEPVPPPPHAATPSASSAPVQLNPFPPPATGSQ